MPGLISQPAPFDDAAPCNDSARPLNNKIAFHRAKYFAIRSITPRSFEVSLLNRLLQTAGTRKPATSRISNEATAEANQVPATPLQLEPTPKPQKRSFPLPMVLDACPDIAEHAPYGIGSWRDLVSTAALVAPWLGISPSAWEDAKEALGPEDAAVVLAAILQRSTVINSAGGYLRKLTEKARAGTFSIGPVLMALINAKLRNNSQKQRA